MTHDIRAPLARSRNARRAALLIIRFCHHAALGCARRRVWFRNPRPLLVFLLCGYGSWACAGEHGARLATMIRHYELKKGSLDSITFK